MREDAVRIILLAGVALCGGCVGDHHGGTRGLPDQQVKRVEGQTIITSLDQYADVERRSDKVPYPILVGSYGDGGARQGKTFVEAFDATDEVCAAAVETITGWTYIVRPPAWPIATTPRVRGGVPLTAVCPAQRVYVIAYADGMVERIIYLGATDAAGNQVNCTLHVEADGVEATGAVDLAPGRYAEVRLSTVTTPPWGAVIIGPTPTPPEVQALIDYVHQRALNAGMPWNSGVAVP